MGGLELPNWRCTSADRRRSRPVCKGQIRQFSDEFHKLSRNDPTDPRKDGEAKRPIIKNCYLVTDALLLERTFELHGIFCSGLVGYGLPPGRSDCAETNPV